MERALRPSNSTNQHDPLSFSQSDDDDAIHTNGGTGVSVWRLASDTKMNSLVNDFRSKTQCAEHIRPLLRAFVRCKQ